MSKAITLSLIIILGLAISNQDQGITKILIPEFNATDLSIPKSINFQGYLYRDGNPMDTTMNMWFGIYDDPAAGNLLFQLTINNILVTKGWFTVTLDNVPNSVFPVVGATRYLEIKAPSTGPSLSPRISLVSVGYSYHSITADSAEYAKAALLSRPITPPIYNTEIRDTTITTAKIKDSAITSAKILDATIKGVDIAMPCSLQGSAVSTGAILNIRNNSTGRGIIIDRVGSFGIYIDSSLSGSGIYVNKVDDYGMYVDSSGSSGVVISKAGMNGIQVNDAARHGVRVNQADSCGLFVYRAAKNGVYVDSAGSNGVYVNRVGSDGFNVYRARRFGVRVDSAGDNGLSIGRTGENGIRIVYPNMTGVYIDSAGEHGIKIVNADFYGLYIAKAGYHGIAIDNAGDNGIDIYKTGDCGMYVDSAGTYGVRVMKANNGFRVDTATTHGVRVLRANEDGIHVWDAGRDGVRVWRSDEHGFYVDSAANLGVYVNRADTGVMVKQAETGIVVDSVHHHGIDVNDADVGLYVLNSRSSGVLIQDAGNYGLVVYNANFSGVKAWGDDAGGQFIADLPEGEGLKANSYNNSVTDTAIRAFGKGIATGGWATDFDKGEEAPCIVSSDRTIVAYGSSKLTDGKIQYPSIFSKNIRNDIPVSITMTPKEEPSGFLYVKETDANGFQVGFKKIPGWEVKNDIRFSWIAIGTLKEPVTSAEAKAEWEKLMREREERRTIREKINQDRGKY